MSLYHVPMSVSSASVLLINGSSRSWWNLGLCCTSLVRLKEGGGREREREREGEERREGERKEGGEDREVCTIDQAVQHNIKENTTQPFSQKMSCLGS